MSSWGFKDNLTIDNNKFIKWYDSTNIIRNIIGVDSLSNINLNSGSGGDIFINSNNSGSNTFINANNINNTFINSKLAIGINTTSNVTLNSNIVLPLNGWIGSNSTAGFIGVSGSTTLDTAGSKILLYGNSGQISINSGNNTAGTISLYTGSGNSLKMQILNTGDINFQPNGSTIRLSIADANCTITNDTVFTSTTNSFSSTSGAVQINGGIGIIGNTYISGTLSINSILGNLNFNNTAVSTSYSTGTFFISGGFGIECSTSAISQFNGGALSVAGGLALGKNAILGGNIVVFNSDVSVSSVTGSGTFYGGVGINGQTNIKSDLTSQIKITPLTSNLETSIFFGSLNDYTSSGSWTIGHNVNSISSGNFGFYNANNGNFIRLNSTNSTIYLDKYTTLLNTLNFDSTIANLITLNTNWSIGITNGNFMLFGNSKTNLISDISTGNFTIYSTENSISITNGGALLIKGGLSVIKDFNIGGTIFGPSLNITNQTSVSLLTTNIIATNSSLANLLSSNVTISNLIVTNGLFTNISSSTLIISSTTDSLNITSGSTIVLGGLGVSKSIYAGRNIIVGTPNTESVFGSCQLLLCNNNSTVGSSGIQLQRSFANTCSLGVNNSGYMVFSVNNQLRNFIFQEGNSDFSESGTARLTISTSSISTPISINATFNSNTIGNLFTTGGNVGINTNTPSFTLDVTGTARFSTGLTTGTITATNSTIPNSVFTNISSSTLNINTITAASMLSTVSRINSRLDIGGIQPNFSTNTLGSLFITGVNSSVNGPNIIINTNQDIYPTYEFMTFGHNSMWQMYDMYYDGSFRSSSTSTGFFMSKEANQISWYYNTPGSAGSILFPTTTALVIGSGGNIGMGNNGSPSFTLDVTGTGRFTIGLTTGTLTATNASIPNIVSTNTSTGSLNVNNLSATNISTSSFISNVNILTNLVLTSGSFGNLSGANIQLSGNISIGSNLILNGTVFNAINAIGTISSLLISSTNNASGLNSGGSLTILGGMSIAKTVYLGDFLSIGSSNLNPQQNIQINAVNYDINQDSGIRISTKNPISTTHPSYRYIDIRLKSDIMTNFRGSIIGTLAGGTQTEYEYMSFSQDGLTNIYSQSQFLNTTSSLNSSTGSIIINGGLCINSGINSSSLTAGGCLTINGGASINGKLYYLNGIGSNNTFGSVSITDICNISNTTNATSITNGGSFTNFGGMSVVKDLFIGGTSYLPFISAGNSILTNSSISNLYINNTIVSSNNSTGSLVSLGGISIYNTNNASSVTAGGCLTIGGGASILKDLYIGGTMVNSSDIRLKTNLQPIHNTLDKIDDIRTVKYQLKHSINPTFLYGFIAQDFEENFPELLYKHAHESYYALDYTKVTVLLMSCIKELKAEIKLLKNM